jgi:hypothetical protein
MLAPATAALRCCHENADYDRRRGVFVGCIGQGGSQDATKMPDLPQMSAVTAVAMLLAQLHSSWLGPFYAFPGVGKTVTNSPIYVMG